MIKKIIYLILAFCFVLIIPKIIHADIGLDVGTNYTRITMSETRGTDLFSYLGINWIRTLTPNLRLPPVNGQEVNILAVYPYNCGDTSEDKEQTFIQAVNNNPAVKAVEIGNEPNIEETDKFKGRNNDFDCPPEVFGDQVIRMHNALSPSGRKIIFGGLFIKDSLHAGLYNMNPDTQNNYVTPYLTQVMSYFRSKGVNPWDAIGLHFYVNEDGSRDPDYILGKYQSYISAIRRVTVSLPIWVTEYGWRSDYGKMDPERQAEFLKVTSNWLKKNVEMAFWYSQIDSVQHDKWQRLGVYDAQAELIKPSFFALKSVQGSLTTCVEGADRVSCTIAGPAAQSCKWETCAGKSSCIDSDKGVDCAAIQAQQAAQEVQRKAQEEAERARLAAERPLAEARGQAEQANQNASLRLSGFQMSHCLYLSEQNCNLSSDCAVQDRRAQGRNQNVCLPKEQKEDDNILQIGVRYYSADFATLNEKYCRRDDQDCKRIVLVNCINNKIKNPNTDIDACGRLYAAPKSKQTIIDSICAKESEDIPEYDPEECKNNIQCNNDTVIADANFVDCVGQARERTRKDALARAGEARRAAPQPPAGAPAEAAPPGAAAEGVPRPADAVPAVTEGAGRSAPPPAPVAQRSQVSYSDFCDNKDRDCFDVFNLSCEYAQDTQQCMLEYGYYPAAVPAQPTAAAPGAPAQAPSGAGPAVGQPGATQPVLTDEQCAQDYKSKRGGQHDYYCDNDNTCTLRTQISDGQGGCKDEFKRGQDLSKCPNSCQVAEGSAEDEVKNQLISQLNSLCNNLPNSQDKRDCPRELERTVVVSCLNVSGTENCINKEIENWLQIRLVNKRANQLRQTCEYTNACFSKASQACPPTTADENEFNSCVQKFTEENPIKDRDWQVSMLGVLCAQYFGPDNVNSDRCVSDSDNQCKGYIIENDFTACVSDSAQKQGAKPGQKILYKVALNCPGEENYTGEKIIYLNNQPQDQTFIIPDYVDQIACELKEYYANFTPNADGVDEHGNKIQTVIFTNKELPEEEQAGTTLGPNEGELPPIQPSCREEARDLGQGVAQNFEICPDKQPTERGSQYCVNGNPNIEDCSATPGEDCTYNEGEPFCEAGQQHTCRGVYNQQGICQYKEGVDPDCSPCS